MVSSRVAVAEVFVHAEEGAQGAMRRSRRSSNLLHLQRRQGQKPTWPQRFLLLLACCSIWMVRLAFEQPATSEWLSEFIAGPASATEDEEAKESMPLVRLDLYNWTPVAPAGWSNTTFAEQPAYISDALLRTNYRPSIVDSVLEFAQAAPLDLRSDSPPQNVTAATFFNVTPVNATAGSAPYRPSVFDSVLEFAQAAPLDLRSDSPQQNVTAATFFNVTPVNATADSAPYRPSVFDSALAWLTSAPQEPLIDLMNHTPVPLGDAPLQLHREQDAEVPAVAAANATSADSADCATSPCET